MTAQRVYDFIVVGSGFGGSVSAMRLAEKGYAVLVLERGRRYADQDFPRSNWHLSKFLWKPALRCFGLMEISLLNHVMAMHASGVGGGSLIYGNVLMEPEAHLFEADGWRDLNDWQTALRPHYDAAKWMLGVTKNPYHSPVDSILGEVAASYGRQQTFTQTNVAVFFGEAGATVPDPYFGGEGPARTGCNECGGCMVGCRHNAKNSLPKNYLYFAEKWGAEIRAEAEVIDIIPLPQPQDDGARYELVYRNPTRFPFNQKRWRVRAKNVVISAHVLGTLKLLLHCRDVSGTLPKLSPRLGEQVRTNSEALTASTSRLKDVDYSSGLAITSMFELDDITRVEVVRYPKGSGFIRLLGIPMVGGEGSLGRRLLKILGHGLRHPMDFIRTKFSSGWAQRSTILLMMQTVDSTMRIKLGRHPFTGFVRGLVTQLEAGQTIKPPFELSHGMTQRFAEQTEGIPQDSIPEALMGIPATAHLLGGCPMGATVEQGVVNQYCEVFNYDGLYIVDGSIMPANPGINPSLTITALAEYAMSHIAPAPNAEARPPLGYERITPRAEELTH